MAYGLADLPHWNAVRWRSYQRELDELVEQALEELPSTGTTLEEAASWTR